MIYWGKIRILNAECTKTMYNAMDVVNKGRNSNHILPRKGLDTKQTTSNTEKVLKPAYHNSLSGIGTYTLSQNHASTKEVYVHIPN